MKSRIERESSPRPTGAEVDILQVLRERGTSTVREVHESLYANEGAGYTTAPKMLQIMAMVLVLPLTGVAADTNVVEKPVTADTAEKFAQATAEVRDAMGPGGRYEFISPDSRAKVEADMNKMTSLFQQTASVDAMTEEQKLKLFNTQEHLNGVLTHSDRNRLVCERRAPVGTNIPVTTCRTVGDIEYERRVSQKFHQDQDTLSHQCSPYYNKSGCKGG
jgi:hypothetical protein